MLDKDGKPVLDKLADPAKISDVLKTYATDYGFPFKEEDAGGRGSASSKGDNSKLNYKGKTFAEALEANGIKPNTDESDKLYTEWVTANQ